MAISVQESILTTLLDCGACDLFVLDDIKYDVSSMVEELQSDGRLSLNNLMNEVFWRGVSDVNDAFIENREDIITDIEAEIDEVKDEEEAAEEYSDEYIQLLNDLELAQNWKDLTDAGNWDCETNCSYNSVSIKHLEFLKKWMPNEVSDAETNMGYYFTEKTW